MCRWKIWRNYVIQSCQRGPESQMWCFEHCAESMPRGTKAVLSVCVCTTWVSCRKSPELVPCFQQRQQMQCFQREDSSNHLLTTKINHLMINPIQTTCPASQVEDSISMSNTFRHCLFPNMIRHKYWFSCKDFINHFGGSAVFLYTWKNCAWLPLHYCGRCGNLNTSDWLLIILSAEGWLCLHRCIQLSGLSSRYDSAGKANDGWPGTGKEWCGSFFGMLCVCMHTSMHTVHACVCSRLVLK